MNDYLNGKVKIKAIMKATGNCYYEYPKGQIYPVPETNAFDIASGAFAILAIFAVIAITFLL